MQKETLKKIIAEFDGDDLAERLSVQLAVEKSIKAKYKKYIHDIDALEKKYSEEKSQLKETLVIIQNSCPHHEYTYYPDVSGNNDSCYVCDWCHKEVRKPSQF